MTFVSLTGALLVSCYWQMYVSVIRSPVWDMGREGSMADEEAYSFFSAAAWIDHELTEKRTLKYVSGTWKRAEIFLVGEPLLPAVEPGEAWMIVEDQWKKGEQEHRLWTKIYFDLSGEFPADTHFYYPSRPLLDQDSKESVRTQVYNSLARENRRRLPGYFSVFPVRLPGEKPFTSPEGNPGLVISELTLRPWPRGEPFPYGDKAIHNSSDRYTVSDSGKKDVDRLVVYADDTFLAKLHIRTKRHWALVFERISEIENAELERIRVAGRAKSEKKAN